MPIRRSVTDDHIVCLEDGKKLKMLKRHLMTEHAVTPEQYRARWSLKPEGRYTVASRRASGCHCFAGDLHERALIAERAAGGGPFFDLVAASRHFLQVLVKGTEASPFSSPRLFGPLEEPLTNRNTPRCSTRRPARRHRRRVNGFSAPRREQAGHDAAPPSLGAGPCRRGHMISVDRRNAHRIYDRSKLWTTRLVRFGSTLATLHERRSPWIAVTGWESLWETDLCSSVLFSLPR